MKFLYLSVLLAIASCQAFYSTKDSNNIINVCHCDLTYKFCDYNCCCDPDCSSAVINGLKSAGLYCQNNSMVTYCLDPSYFAFIRINSQSKTIESNGLECYDFNNTRNDQPQVKLTLSVVKSIVNSQKDQINENVQSQTFYSNGYDKDKIFLTLTSPISMNGGLCSVTQNNKVFYFGQDISITCTASQGQSSSIDLFKPFFGLTTIQSFKNEASMGNITLGTLQYKNSQNVDLSKVTLAVFYSSLGIQNDPLLYIIDAKLIPHYENSETYTMEIKFVDIKSLQEQAGLWSIIGAPFFPMIPQDMFYPLIYNNQQMLKNITFFLLVLLSAILL